jgi:hypothetical protein
VPPMVDQSKMNPDSFWLGIVKTAVAQILVLVALVAAIVWYVNWSSEAAMSEFMRAGTPPVAGANLHPQSRAPVQTVKGKAVCVRKLGA